MWFCLSEFRKAHGVPLADSAVSSHMIGSEASHVITGNRTSLRDTSRQKSYSTKISDSSSIRSFVPTSSFSLSTAMSSSRLNSASVRPKSHSYSSHSSSFSSSGPTVCLLARCRLLAIALCHVFCCFLRTVCF